MLANIENDLLYLLNMIEGIEKIFIYSTDFKNAEELFAYSEQLNFNATLNLFAMLGENVSKISDGLKNKYSEIKWRDIKDFRNKVVHDYINIDIFIVFSIIKNDLANLKDDLEQIVANELKNGIFNEEEFNISKNSIYYKHINFDKIEKEHLQ